MEKIKKIIFSSTLKNTSVLLLGNVVTSVLAIIFTLFTARGLEPAGWGIVAAAISVITIGEAIGDLGLTSSLYHFVTRNIAKGKKRTAQNFKQALFWIRLASVSLILLIFTLFAPLISPLLFKESDWFLSFSSGLGIAAYLLLEFQTTIFQAEHKWKLAASFIAFVNLIRLIGVLALYFSSKLTIGTSLWMCSLAPLITLGLTLYWEPIRFTSVKNWQKVVKSVFRFSGWLGLNRAAGATAARLDILIILSLVGAYEAGLFSAAKQLAVGVPMIIGSIAAVLAPRFSTLTEKSLLDYFKKTIFLSLGLSFGILLGIFISPFVISLFGPKYQESTLILQWLLVGFIPFAIATPAVNLLIYAFHKPKIIGLLSLFQIPIVWALNVFLIPQIGAWGAVVVHIIWNLSTLIVAYLFVGYYLSKWKKH